MQPQRNELTMGPQFNASKTHTMKPIERMHPIKSTRLSLLRNVPVLTVLVSLNTAVMITKATPPNTTLIQKSVIHVSKYAGRRLESKHTHPISM